MFVRQEEYETIVAHPQKFRAWVDRDYRLNPENYPEIFEQGYKLHDYWDWGRKSVKDNNGCRCPAERLNGKRYAECWLENLLVATSAVQKRKSPPHKTV